MIRESIFEQLQRIPEDLAETHEKLMNWAAWSRDRLKRGHCRSIEHRYVPERAADDEERVPHERWDCIAAEEVHSVVCELPEKHRWLVHLHLLHRAPEGYIRRTLAIRRDDLVPEFHKALRMVRNRMRA